MLKLVHSAATVLIIEDDDDIREPLADLLEFEGFIVLRASNGAEALLVLAQRTIDVILLDLMMPVMNGFDFMKELQKYSTVADVPVVIMSALPKEHFTAKASELPAPARYLRKPVQVSTIVEALQLVLAR